MALAINTILKDRYRITSVLGQGGMGNVYKAYDSNLDVFVAIKENLYLSEEYTKQFQREATILASLHAAHLPRVSDYFMISGQGQYLLMDFIEGDDLRKKIEMHGSIEENEAVIIGSLICDALDYLHTRPSPIIHRDIKPGNIKLTPDGDVFLVDFGLAKVMVDSQATSTGARAMTPGYSPPEQYGKARTDARSDIYALGATLYAALTGFIPEDGLERLTGNEKLTQLRELNPKLSKKLAAVIEKALEVDPDKRFQTALDFKHALLTTGGLPQYSLPKLQLEKSVVPVDLGIEEGATAAPVQFKPITQVPPKPKEKTSLLKLALPLLAVLILVSAYFVLRNPAWFNASGTPTDPTYTLVAPTEPKTVNPVSTPPPVATENLPTSVPTEIIVTATVSNAPVVPAPGSEEKKIAFVSNRTGDYQIWLMNDDGSSQRQLSNFEEGACQPSWSPDGLQLAVISPCKDRFLLQHNDSHIYVLDVQTGNATRLFPDGEPGDFHPAWAPDGTRIAFSSIRGGGYPHIYVYNFNDQTIGELSDSPKADIFPSWNPTSKQLAVSRMDIFYHIFMLSDRGTTQYQFSGTGSINDYWPDWSGDGEFVIYSRLQLDPAIPFLYILNLEDRGKGIEKRIPDKPVTGLGPIAFARLGNADKSIVFESWPDGKNHDIYFMNLDGTELLRLTTDPAMDFQPAWQP